MVHDSVRCLSAIETALVKSTTSAKGAYPRCLKGPSAPVVAPLVVVDDFHSALAQGVQARGVSVCLSVIDARDVRVDRHLGAHHARGCADEHHLAWELGAGFDHGVHLAVNAAAGSRSRRVAAIRQAAGVAVIAD